MTRNWPTAAPDPELRARRERLLADARLYLCTDARAGRGDLEAFLHAAYAGGVDIIQLRDKALEARAEIEALRLLAAVAKEHGRLFAVNDRADVAALTGADVFHVGQGDLTTAQARALLGPDVLLGRSNRTEAMFAESLADPGIDYAVIGPVWATPTKPGRAPVGTGMVARAAELAAAAGKPWFAIGGVDAGRVPGLRARGAERVVVVRAIADAADPAAAARRLRAALLG
ncbi:thiamine phosphate synthase [Corynebacterium sphenisci]|uniref:thiamine phosphate synthase n=1 Tax=Corynebacterium sphenisci TaxID=191493 RepID=UPI0026DF1CC6|nr:thiamine phosphate synthase [Corynebacterium sphenisci]MDO5731293.1 thiamine phosphate synthase [Corynebacterium sphenisci]